MVVRLSVAAILLIASASAVAAQENMCGDLPIGPLLPSPADIQKKSPADADAAQRDAFLDIKRWQGSLKTYRDCLNASADTDNREIGEAERSDKPDTKKIDKLHADSLNLSHAWDASVDEEEQVVNQFHALQTAYCSRGDVNGASCPNQQKAGQAGAR
jgi:hypothetical protein